MMQSTDQDQDQDEVLADEVAAVMRMARVVFSTITRTVDHVDDALTLTQLRTLVLVATSPTQVTTSAVAETLEVHLSTASRLCDRLVNAGWLQRNESLEDRRQFILSLTAQGTALLAQVMAYRREAFEEILGQMPAGDRAVVRVGCESFAEAANDSPSHLDRPTARRASSTRAVARPGGQ